MFHPMAMTVIFALIAAFVLSLTFVPAMVAIIVRGKVQEKESFLVRAAKAPYAPIIRGAVRARWAVVALAIAAFAGSLVIAGRLGQEFVPTLDERDIAMHAMRIPSTSLTQSTEMQFEVERAVSKFPEVAFVFSKTGTAEMASDPMPPNVSDTFIILRSREEWPDPLETKESLRMRLEEAVERVPGNNYEWTQPIEMRFNELLAGVRGDVAVKVYGDDFEKMRITAERIKSVLQGIEGSADVKVEQTTGLPVMSIRIDRQAIARYGLKMVDVQEVVAAAVGGREAGQVFEGDRRFDLVVRLPDAMRRDVDTIRNLPIPIAHHEGESDAGSSGDVVASLDAPQSMEVAFVPLSSLAEVEVAEGMNQVSRENGKRRIVVQCNVRGRDLGSFVMAAQEAVKSVELPPGGWLDWGGEFENLVAARKRLTVVVPVCFLLIFFLLYSAFGSVRFALLVFSCVPLGLTGGILALWLRDMPFSITAHVGFIALSGVAVLNGLVMVSCINQLRREGAEVNDAIERGALLRLRPVLMTALVASLGFVPMALATGTGAEVQKPLATVVIGGLISSTLLTLVVLPALYRMFAGRSSLKSTEPEAAVQE
jgi:cobalt-zinc-cadmium resistance protein CzcA